MILFLTFINTLGVQLGKLIQNVFTTCQDALSCGIDFLGIFVGRNAGAITENFSHFWAIRNAQPIEPGANFLRSFVPTITAASGAFGLFCGIRSGASWFLVFCGRLEQYRFHSRGS